MSVKRFPLPVTIALVLVAGLAVLGGLLFLRAPEPPPAVSPSVVRSPDHPSSAPPTAAQATQVESYMTQRA